MLRYTGLVRPGQGFKPFTVMRGTGGTTPKGRPYTGDKEPVGTILGIISAASPTEIEQWKQKGHPITHTIVQRGTKDRAQAEDVLVLDGGKRRFLVKGKPHDPGELGHYLVYHVEEREDLQ